MANFEQCGSVSRRRFLGSGIAAVSLAAQKVSAQPTGPAQPEMEAVRQLLEAARLAKPTLADLMRSTLPGLGNGGAAAVDADALLGTAGDEHWGTVASNGTVAVWGDEFFFSLASEEKATIEIDTGPPLPMMLVEGSNLWYRLERLRLGTTHNFTLFSGGRNVGSGSVAGYGPESYPDAKGPRGTFAAQKTVVSRVYGGAEAACWLYVNAGIDERRGAPLMVWLDGQLFTGRTDPLNVRMQTVTDNLVALGRIPPMVHLMLSPGTGGTPQTPQFAGEAQAGAMRSLQYDTVSDTFNRYLREEVLPQVEKQVKLRQDGYSRGITGQSSGGICAFKVAWFESGRYSRVLSSIGSFTGLQSHPEVHQDGGYIFPFLVRREPRRNIRVWLSDGRNDLDVDHTGRNDIYKAGSWPLANLQMAQSLKSSGYDFHFRFGTAYHNTSQWGLDLPESLSWLWRGYDPEKTTETYEQEEAEKAKPLYRVEVVNRDAW